MDERASLGVPVAIVIAGALIAGALYFRGSTSTPAPTAPAAPDVKVIAKKVGVPNLAQFEACRASHKYAARIDNDKKDGASAGVTGTPHSIIITADGHKIAFSGAQPYDNLKQALTAALAPAPTVSSAPQPSVEPVGQIRSVTADDHARGTQNPKITLIEYSDLQCPFCRQFHPSLLQMLKDFPDVQWVFRHFPLETIHPQARAYADAVECASEQGKFWEMTDALYAAQG